MLDVSAKICTIETRPWRHKSIPSRSRANLLGCKPVVGAISARHWSIEVVVSTRTTVGDAIEGKQRLDSSQSGTSCLIYISPLSGLELCETLRDETLSDYMTVRLDETSETE